MSRLWQIVACLSFVLVCIQCHQVPTHNRLSRRGWPFTSRAPARPGTAALLSESERELAQLERAEHAKEEAIRAEDDIDWKTILEEGAAKLKEKSEKDPLPFRQLKLFLEYSEQTERMRVKTAAMFTGKISEQTIQVQDFGTYRMDKPGWKLTQVRKKHDDPGRLLKNVPRKLDLESFLQYFTNWQGLLAYIREEIEPSLLSKVSPYPNNNEDQYLFFTRLIQQKPVKERLKILEALSRIQVVTLEQRDASGQPTFKVFSALIYDQFRRQSVHTSVRIRVSGPETFEHGEAFIDKFPPDDPAYPGDDEHKNFFIIDATD